MQEYAFSGYTVTSDRKKADSGFTIGAKKFLYQ